jgi:hypothetical protein
MDLYRAGNGAGPRMEHVRPNRDIAVLQRSGVDWVDPQCGGISTRERAFWPFRFWWRIPKGTAFSDRLTIRNDHGDHWVWEPAQAMELSDYVQLLASLNSEFIRV